MARTSAKDKENVVEEVTTTSVTTAENEELKALRDENARLKKQLKEKGLFFLFLITYSIIFTNLFF